MDSEAKGARCPKCGSVVSVRQLEVEGDAGREVVYFIICPRGDLNLAVTHHDVVDAATRVVMERLRLS